MLLSEWLETCIRTRPIKDATRDDYRTLNRLWVAPRLHMSLEDVRPIHLQEWVNDLPLSPARVRHAYALVRMGYTQALFNELVPRTPCVGIQLPRTLPREMHPLTPAQVRTIARDTGHYESLVLFLAVTGCRVGEAIALAPEDVQGRLVTISRSTRRFGGHLYHTDTKNHQRRTVLLPEWLLPLLRSSGTLPTGGQWVFSSPKGAQVDYSNFRNAFTRACKANGVSARIHDLRHTYASLLLGENVHPKVVQKTLGHSSIKVTMDVYSHLTDTHLETASDAISHAWGQFD